MALVVLENREGNNLKGFKDFRTENGSSRSQNLALNGEFVQSLLDSGPENPGGAPPPAQ